MGAVLECIAGRDTAHLKEERDKALIAFTKAKRDAELKYSRIVVHRGASEVEKRQRARQRVALSHRIRQIDNAIHTIEDTELLEVMNTIAAVLPNTLSPALTARELTRERQAMTDFSRRAHQTAETLTSLSDVTTDALDGVGCSFSDEITDEEIDAEIATLTLAMMPAAPATQPADDDNDNSTEQSALLLPNAS